MDFQQLECLIEVCKYRSFTRAANALFLSQSSISKNIAALEQELDISLLERTRHHVKPTKAGLYLARQAERIVADVTQAAEQAKQIASGKMGFLKIGISDEMDINRLLPGFISSFSCKYPEIEISISIHDYRELANLILVGTLDVAFAPCNTVVGQDIEDLEEIVVNRAKPKLYYSVDHRNARKKDLALSDFANDNYISMKNRSGRTLAALYNLGASFKRVIYVDSLQAVKLYVEANQGVAVLGESYGIANSSRVKGLVVDGMFEVGTDLIYRNTSSNESTILFSQELLEYQRRHPKR